MASRSNAQRKLLEAEATVQYVQCDGLAAMKIVKHCHEESVNNMDVAQGALLGLVVDNRLEITNCFPFPKNNDDTLDEEEYQLAMMRRLRRVNVDHFHVGWYQSSDVGNFFNLALLESQFHYQTSIEESVVLIYDTPKSARGFLTIKAYRLSPQAIELYKEGEFGPENLLKWKTGFENLLVEVPIVIKNSPLCNIMMSEVSEMLPNENVNFLDLGTASVLENQLRCLMDRVDELNQEAMKFNRYQQLVNRQVQDKQRYLQRRQLEIAARQAKDEAPLPEEDINKLFKPLPVPPRLNPMIVGGQIDTYTGHISQFCHQSLAKLYMTQALQGAKETKNA